MTLRFSFQKNSKTTTWKKKNIGRQKQLNSWEEAFPILERNIPPHEISKCFLTGEEMESSSLESTNYARLKGESDVTMTLDKLKAFIPVLLVSG